MQQARKGRYGVTDCALQLAIPLLRTFACTCSSVAAAAFMLHSNNCSFTASNQQPNSATNQLQSLLAPTCRAVRRQLGQRSGGSTHVDVEPLADGIDARAAVGALGEAVAAGKGQVKSAALAVARFWQAGGKRATWENPQLRGGSSQGKLVRQQQQADCTGQPSAAQHSTACSPQQLSPAGVFQQHCRLAHHHKQRCAQGVGQGKVGLREVPLVVQLQRLQLLHRTVASSHTCTEPRGAGCGGSML